MKRLLLSAVVGAFVVGAGVYAQSKGKAQAPQPKDEDAQLLEQARQFFQPLPTVVEKPQNPITKPRKKWSLAERSIMSQGFQKAVL